MHPGDLAPLRDALIEGRSEARPLDVCPDDRVPQRVGVEGVAVVGVGQDRALLGVEAARRCQHRRLQVAAGLEPAGVGAEAVGEHRGVEPVQVVPQLVVGEVVVDVQLQSAGGLEAAQLGGQDGVDRFTAALDAAHVPLPREYVRRGEFHHADGVSEGRALLSLPEPPTAIFASSDVQALGVYESARAMGVAIPSALSVVGFDDLKIARWAGPALTTVHVPIAEMAEQAAQIVLGLWQERTPTFGRIDMATTLIVRDSTAPPLRG